MIDQARYKHQQHRHKFKEAIAYLDEIFEDLKKECEPVSPSSNCRKKSPLSDLSKATRRSWATPPTSKRSATPTA
jgi:hypothetical protein